MKITSLHTQRKIIQFDEFYPQENPLFYFLLSQFLFFNFLEKRKNENGLILYCFGPKLAKPARPTSSLAPRPQLAPGPAKHRAPARPLGPRRWPVRSRPSVQIRRPSVHFARIKPRRRAPPGKTLASFFPVLSLSSPLSLSLSFLLSAAQQQPSDEQAKQWSREPRRRRRPPRRRARSPAGERATIERPGRGTRVA